MLQLQILSQLQFAACKWENFIQQCKNIDLIKRAKYSPASFIVWDTIGDKNSYLRVGDDLATIAMQAVIELELVPIDMETNQPLIVMKDQVYYAPISDWQDYGMLLSFTNSSRLEVASMNS